MISVYVRMILDAVFLDVLMGPGRAWNENWVGTAVVTCADLHLSRKLGSLTF